MNKTKAKDITKKIVMIGGIYCLIECAYFMGKGQVLGMLCLEDADTPKELLEYISSNEGNFKGASKLCVKITEITAKTEMRRGS